jgi:hypothetical protein
VSGFGQGLASSGLSLVNGKRLMLLLEQSGATENASRVRMLLKNMVGPWGLEPQTSTVSTTYKTAGTAKVRGSSYKTYFLWVGNDLHASPIEKHPRFAGPITGLIVVATMTLRVKVTCGFSEDRRRTR